MAEPVGTSNQIQLCLCSQNHRAALKIDKLSQPYQMQEFFLVPVEEIDLAIGFLSREFCIRPRYDLGKFHDAHKGQLSERYQNRTAIFKCFDNDGGSRFRNELDMFLRFNNESIIPFIGYCRHMNDSILVLEYAVNGSLYDHLYDTNKRHFLTWEKRLKICLGAARGLKYLHSGLGEHTRVIHGNMKSAMILLDDKLEAKISGFHFAELVDEDQPKVYESIRHTHVYMDPLYTGIMKTESDVYSFGVVLCEVLSGMLAHEERSIGDASPQKLMDLVRRKNDGGLENIIDLYIKDEINVDSLQAFMKIAN